MSPLLEYFTKGGPINKDQFLATLSANPGAASDVDPKTGNTPLHFVCCNGAPRDLVEPLLTANPTAAATADLDGFLPLVGALSCGAAADVIDLLLAANPAAASTKVDGRTPLHYAVSHGCDVRVTKALVRLFPDVCACVEIKILRRVRAESSRRPPRHRREWVSHWLIPTQACATRDSDGNAPLHFALVRCAAPEVVDVLVRARPVACGQRGFLGRLPLQLAKLYGAAPSTLEVLTDAYPGAADCDKPAITQRTTPPRTRPSKRKGAAARRPSKRVARTVTPPDLHNVVPPFDDDYDALGLGAGCGWLDDIFDEGHALQPSYEESLEDLGLDEVKARCAAAGLDTTVRKTDGEPGKGRFKRVLVARLLASAAAARTVRDVSPDASPRAVACV